MHKPYTILHKPYTILHKPYTILHKPYTILHKPYTILHKPYTILHKAYTILHKPYTILHNYYYKNVIFLAANYSIQEVIIMNQRLFFDDLMNSGTIRSLKFTSPNIETCDDSIVYIMVSVM